MVLRFWYNIVLLIVFGVCFWENTKDVVAQDIDVSTDSTAVQSVGVINKEELEKHMRLFDETKQRMNKDIVSLSFVWNTPVNIAAFERNGKIWMVFDRPNAVNVANLKEEAQNLAKEIYTLPHPGGTIVIV